VICLQAWMRMRGEQRGTATLEMMFAFPIIFLVLICGFMLGYHQFVKTALVWQVFKRTEDLASRTPGVGGLDSLNGLLDPKPVAGLTGDTKSLSAAIPITGHSFTVSVACHPTPLQIPQFDFGKGSQPVSSPSPAGGSGIEQIDRLLQSVTAFTNHVGGVLDPVEDIRDDVFLAREVALQVTSKRAAARLQGVRLVTSWGVETMMAKTCEQPGKRVIVARAVAWTEKTKAIKEAGLAQVDFH
jgi:hypothetical protein